MKKNVYFLLPILLVLSCTSDNKEDLKPKPETGSNIPICDTTNITYALSVKPIVDKNCASCHGRAGNNEPSLETYNNVKTVVLDGYLIGTITHSPGYIQMPYGKPKLSDCDISKIKIWVNNGAPNN